MVAQQAFHTDDEERSYNEESFVQGGVDMKHIMNRHQCGDGYWGEVVKTHGIKFCGFCGHEFMR